MTAEALIRSAKLQVLLKHDIGRAEQQGTVNASKIFDRSSIVRLNKQSTECRAYNDFQRTTTGLITERTGRHDRVERCNLTGFFKGSGRTTPRLKSWETPVGPPMIDDPTVSTVKFISRLQSRFGNLYLCAALRDGTTDHGGINRTVTILSASRNSPASTERFTIPINNRLWRERLSTSGWLK